MFSRQDLKIAAVFGVVGALLAGIAAKLIPPRFESRSVVLVQRNRVAFPGMNFEEDKNRWVWVRDGFALRDSLLADQFLIDYLETRPAFQERLEKKAPSEYAWPWLSDRVRRQIRVDYTGGDEFSYVIVARDRNPEEARALAEVLSKRLVTLATTDLTAQYQQTLAHFEKRLSELPPKSEDSKALRAKYRELKMATWLQEAQERNAVKILEGARFPHAPCWPRGGLWICIGAVLGVAFRFAFTRLRPWFGGFGR
ncbi:MAG: hypothetical protein HYR96_09500 [Deltaproteobacteria bacterium]|nr:hypothetical protein [Deltaproteobacteria bacterium]MBI3295085.1 hypothetical protein [Deltaproteobacteria bacterium]